MVCVNSRQGAPLEAVYVCVGTTEPLLPVLGFCHWPTALLGALGRESPIVLGDDLYSRWRDVERNLRWGHFGI